MLDTTTFVGLDVHARSIKAVSLDVMTGEVRCATFGYDAGAVAEWVRSVDPKARCVYESGVTGFDLQKRLSGLGVDCVVGAVSKMIKPSADRRRKNDRNDAEFLARMLSVGNVVEVWVPDDECEAARDLTRALEDARDDLSRSKQRLSKFLLRHGLAFDERTPTGRRKGNWTRAHWSWIESIRFAEGADNDVLAYYVDAVRRAAEDKARLEGLVEAEARKPRWRRRVDSLRCLKGVDTASAADLVFEAGEFSRFGNARSFAAWVGLTPSEHSSGESDRRGAITKAGNKQAPEEGAGRGRVALPDVLGAAEGPRQGPGPGPGRPQACRQGRAEAGREAGGAARARGPRQQGERGHGARARLLGVGGRPHGRGGVGGPVPRT
ncbi:MAG TPA: IS110 family transposase [Coriobacteriaceae bacterium]|nr:IS110 family transposase [Coriobacteriaceae bacterium]